MQRLNHLLTLLFIRIPRLLVLMQEAFQITIVGEDLRADKVEQREQLLQVVLQRRASDQQPSPRDERPNDLRKNRVDILDPVRLVDHDILETELLQRRFLDETDFVRSDADIEVLRDETGGDELRALLLRAGENDGADVRRPLAKLAGPVLESRFGDDDEMGAGSVCLVFQVGEERDGLKRFAETLCGC